MVKNLKMLRKRKNISQQQLADIIGVSQQSINKYENHAVEPDIATLKKLADYFCTSVDYLIGHTEIDHKIEKVLLGDLNQDEFSLISDYRTLSESEKQSIRMILDNYKLHK